MYTPQKLELLEPQKSVPAHELPFARGFIDVCRFTVAKTVPANPHEYCLREWLDNANQGFYDRFAKLIKTHGYRGRFLRQTYVYLDVDNWRYWESKTIARTGMILNRAKNDDLAQQCCSLSEATGGKHHAKDCDNYTK